MPQVTLSFGTLNGSLDNAVVSNAALDYGGKLIVDAPLLSGDLSTSVYDASGGVRAHAYDTTLIAAHLHFDGIQRMAFSQNALLIRRPFLIHASKIIFTPFGLTVNNANITTAKLGEKPDIEARVEDLQVTPLHNKQGAATGRERVDLRNAALYLLHNHLITIRHLETTIGAKPVQPSRQQGPRPTVGYSGQFGAYIGFGSSAKIGGTPLRYNLALPFSGTPQVRVTSSQTLFIAHPLHPETPLPPLPPPGPLSELRAITKAPAPLLPRHDPLLFHDYLPGGNWINLFDQPSPAQLITAEEISYHIPEIGRNQDDLYVTRSPEVSLNGSVPLMPIYALPAPGDANAFRHYLRKPALYLNASVDVGQFYEQPTNVNASRVQTTVGLYLRPFLIAPNTVIEPGYSVTSNKYSGTAQTYNYSQYSLAINHYFTDDSAVGIRYIASQQSGNSPFDFDVLNTSRELDGRIQLGDRRITVAGGIAYDTVADHVIDYTLAVAPALNGFTPVISYQFFSKTIGLEFAIPGLTF